jgi:hypothetical protein
MKKWLPGQEAIIFSRHALAVMTHGDESDKI